MEIRDLDFCANEEEVREALKDALQDQTREVERLYLTPPNRWEQRVVILILSEEVSTKLLQAAHIKVGWMRFRVRRRITVPRCFKRSGHMVGLGTFKIFRDALSLAKEKEKR